MTRRNMYKGGFILLFNLVMITAIAQILTLGTAEGDCSIPLAFWN